MSKTQRDLTYKHNLTIGRHGWLRLTPAHSVKVVQQLLDALPAVTKVLDPFSGTGTTGLVAAERGLNCDLIDINPFLVWFAKVKTRNYGRYALDHASQAIGQVLQLAACADRDDSLWFPPIYDISRWWPERELNVLARIHRSIETYFQENAPAKDLLLVAFCRLVIEASNAAFNHQSMSFKGNPNQPTLWANEREDELLGRFNSLTREIIYTATQPIPGNASVINADARNLPDPEDGRYDCVITSPPYPNRMSYIRELRPYMYWLGYLKEAREAAELDWRAIGGTWGVATSRLKDWQPNGTRIAYADFDQMIEQITNKSPLLANYVHKYFVDAFEHIQSLYIILSEGANVFYIVGNSKFYDVLVPVDRIYAHLFTAAGFDDVKIEVLRKRNSKKELFEYVVSAKKPRAIGIFH